MLTHPLVAADIFVESSVQLHELGQKVEATDGRKFRYAKAGATATVAGKLYQAPIEIGNHQNLAPAEAPVAGDKILKVTLGGTAATENQYAGGWAVVAVTPGEGYCYKIKGHAAQTATGGTLTLALEDSIQVALTVVASKVDLVPNPFNGIILSIGGTNSGKIVGVANDIITAAYFGWIQTGGPCAVLNQGNCVVADELCASNGTAGAFEIAVAGQPVIGQAMTTGTGAEYNAVWLSLD